MIEWSNLEKSLLRTIMEKTKVIIIALCVLIILTIVSATIYKVYATHQEKLILVAEKKLSEAARQCIIDEICSEEEAITLKVLIENKYLDRIVHPISKEYLNENLLINCKNYTCIVSLD